MRRLSISMIGQRGIPATFGGIEHHVEELGSRLAASGHEVNIFCRSNYVIDARANYLGMRLHHVPTVSSKHLDTIVHSALSTIVAMADRPDIIHYHAVGPALLAPLPRYLGHAKVVITVHSLDADRQKWGWAARHVLLAGSWLSARVPDATIAVSRTITDHYEHHYNRKVSYIPNGVTPRARRPAHQIVQRFGLHPGSYILFVGRLVPEKAPDVLIRAFRHLSGDLNLVLAGGSSFTNGYVHALHEAAKGDKRVVFTDYVYGPLLEELYTNAAVFVLPSSLEGLPLTLLEALSYATPVIASQIPAHIEVLGSAGGPGGRLFSPGDEKGLITALTRVLGNFEHEQEGAEKLRENVLRRYSWTEALSATMAIYERVLSTSQEVSSVTR